jgi:hypothetical protein
MFGSSWLQLNQLFLMGRRNRPQQFAFRYAMRQRTNDKDDATSKQEAKSPRIFVRKSHERKMTSPVFYYSKICPSADILLKQLNWNETIRQDSGASLALLPIAGTSRPAHRLFVGFAYATLCQIINT